ncbi:hypothetical protein GCM10028825_16070 [Spirosoma agri]
MLCGKVTHVDSYHMDTVRVGQRLVCAYKHVFFPAKIAERNARKVVSIHAPITASFSDNELKTSTFITDFAFVDLFFISTEQR